MTSKNFHDKEKEKFLISNLKHMCHIVMKRFPKNVFEDTIIIYYIYILFVLNIFLVQNVFFHNYQELIIHKYYVFGVLHCITR